MAAHFDSNSSAYPPYKPMEVGQVEVGGAAKLKESLTDAPAKSPNLSTPNAKGPLFTSSPEMPHVPIMIQLDPKDRSLAIVHWAIDNPHSDPYVRAQKPKLYLSLWVKTESLGSAHDVERLAHIGDPARLAQAFNNLSKACVADLQKQMVAATTKARLFAQELRIGASEVDKLFWVGKGKQQEIRAIDKDNHDITDNVYRTLAGKLVKLIPTQDMRTEVNSQDLVASKQLLKFVQGLGLGILNKLDHEKDLKLSQLEAAYAQKLKEDRLAQSTKQRILTEKLTLRKDLEQKPEKEKVRLKESLRAIEDRLDKARMVQFDQIAAKINRTLFEALEKLEELKNKGSVEQDAKRSGDPASLARSISLAQLREEACKKIEGYLDELGVVDPKIQKENEVVKGAFRKAWLSDVPADVQIGIRALEERLQLIARNFVNTPRKGVYRVYNELLRIGINQHTRMSGSSSTKVGTQKLKEKMEKEKIEKAAEGTAQAKTTAQPIDIEAITPEELLATRERGMTAEADPLKQKAFEEQAEKVHQLLLEAAELAEKEALESTLGSTRGIMDVIESDNSTPKGKVGELKDANAAFYEVIKRLVEAAAVQGLDISVFKKLAKKQIGSLRDYYDTHLQQLAKVSGHAAHKFYPKIIEALKEYVKKVCLEE